MKEKFKPDVIIHLAAQSFPNISWESPVHTFEVNAIGTINLLEAVLKTEIKPKIIISSSSSVYASTTTSEPIKENYPLVETTYMITVGQSSLGLMIIKIILIFSMQ